LAASASKGKIELLTHFIISTYSHVHDQAFEGNKPSRKNIPPLYGIKNQHLREFNPINVINSI
jgi:hypothetical protein